LLKYAIADCSWQKDGETKLAKVFASKVTEVVPVLVDRESAERAVAEVERLTNTKQPLARWIIINRSLCGWTYDDLAVAVGVNKRTIFRHLKGAKPRPDNLLSYAIAFSEKLGREVTIEEVNAINSQTD
jgi:DNA-binding XRE family transcriptional regulator